jgi:DNA-damage-inducible protein J
MQMNYNVERSEGDNMAATALVQTRVDPDVKERAAAVLGRLGLTVSDVVRILLTRTAHEGALPFELLSDPKAHDVWFRRKVQEALDNEEAPIPHEEVAAEFAARRAATRAKLD